MLRQYKKYYYDDLKPLYKEIENIEANKTSFKCVYLDDNNVFFTIQSTAINIVVLYDLVNEFLKRPKTIEAISPDILFVHYTKQDIKNKYRFYIDVQLYENEQIEIVVDSNEISKQNEYVIWVEELLAEDVPVINIDCRRIMTL